MLEKETRREGRRERGRKKEIFSTRLYNEYIVMQKMTEPKANKNEFSCPFIHLRLIFLGFSVIAFCHHKCLENACNHVVWVCPEFCLI